MPESAASPRLIPVREKAARPAQIGEHARPRVGRHNEEAAMGRAAATRRVVDRRGYDAEHVAIRVHRGVAAALTEEEAGMAPTLLMREMTRQPDGNLRHPGGAESRRDPPPKRIGRRPDLGKSVHRQVSAREKYVRPD